MGNTHHVAILWLFPVGALLMALVGAGLLVDGARRTRDWKAFTSRARPASAEVVALRRRTVPGRRHGPGRGTILVPVVRFSTDDGQQVEAQVQYVGATPGVRPGDRLDVRYDPTDPRRVNAAHGPARGSTVGCGQLVVGVGLLLLGGAATAGTASLVLSIGT